MTWTFEALVTAFGLSAELSRLTKATVITLLGLGGAFAVAPFVIWQFVICDLIGDLVIW